jgi:hypothetical protein
MERESRIDPKAILCRDCSNFKGIRAGKERRQATPRLCAAGIEMRPDIFECESYIPLVIASPPRRDADRPPA